MFLVFTLVHELYNVFYIIIGNGFQDGCLSILQPIYYLDIIGAIGFTKQCPVGDRPGAFEVEVVLADSQQLSFSISQLSQPPRKIWA